MNIKLNLDLGLQFMPPIQWFIYVYIAIPGYLSAVTVPPWCCPQVRSLYATNMNYTSCIDPWICTGKQWKDPIYHPEIHYFSKAEERNMFLGFVWFRISKSKLRNQSIESICGCDSMIRPSTTDRPSNRQLPHQRTRIFLDHSWTIQVYHLIKPSLTPPDPSQLLL